MDLAYMSGRLRRRGLLGVPGRELGAAKIRREIVHLDHVLAQRFLALPERELFRRNDLLFLSDRSHLDTWLRNDLSFLDGLAQLLVHRLAGEGGEEGGFDDRGRIGLALADVHARGQAVARRAGLEQDPGALVVAR